MPFLVASAVMFLSAVSLAAGIICLRRPGDIIKFQQCFYARINWRIEPVSIEKEVRNTKIMGIFLILCALSSLCLALW